MIADAENASPEWREVTIPAGTTLPVVLDTGVGSDISRIEAPVSAHLARPIVIGGQTVLADGSRLSGVVTDATRSGRVKGRAHVAVRFTTLTPRGDDERYRISTASVGRTAPATKKKGRAARSACPRRGGAIVRRTRRRQERRGDRRGGRAAAAGRRSSLATRGKEVRMVRGSRITLRLTQPLTVRVPKLTVFVGPAEAGPTSRGARGPPSAGPVKFLSCPSWGPPLGGPYAGCGKQPSVLPDPDPVLSRTIVTSTTRGQSHRCADRSAAVFGLSDAAGHWRDAGGVRIQRLFWGPAS